MLTEAISGLLVNLLSSATGRGLGAFAKAERKKTTIKKILLGTTPTGDPTVAAALKTLVQVLGSGIGAYTTTIQTVISHFSASQLSPALVLSLRTGSNHVSDIKSEFLATYSQKITDSGIDPAAFFDALSEALRAVVFSKYADPDFAILTTEHHAEILARLDDISACLQTAASEPMDAETFDRISMQICKAVVNASRTIGVETSRGQKRVAISTHFIRSRLRRMTADDFFNDVVSITDDPDHTIQYVSFASSFHRVVVLGTPGGGKSTLCQYICNDAAQRVIALQKHAERADHDSAMARIPITVILRRFEKYASDESKNIVDFVVDELSATVDEDRKTLRAWLRQALAHGRAIVLFDGLDEIMDVASRRRYVRSVEGFANTWPCTPILSTSRKVGYTKAPLHEEFHTYELAPFNRSEIVSYASRLIALEKNITKDKSAIPAQEFYSQTDQNASDLRRNPLMLGLMVWLFCVQGEVPSHRAEIYKQCSDLMFERWDKNRGIRAEIPDDFDLVSFFSFLASKIFGKAELEDGVTDDWLENASFQFFRDWYEENAKARSAAKIMQEFITGRAWVMTDVGAGIYKFTHRTFLEFFSLGICLAFMTRLNRWFLPFERRLRMRSGML